MDDLVLDEAVDDLGDVLDLHAEAAGNLLVAEAVDGGAGRGEGGKARRGRVEGEESALPLCCRGW